MPVNAYVLIGVETASTNEVVARLKEIRDLTDVHEVIGPYDIIVEVESDTLEDMIAVIRHKIRPIQGVRSTVTCEWI